MDAAAFNHQFTFVSRLSIGKPRGGFPWSIPKVPSVASEELVKVVFVALDDQFDHVSVVSTATVEVAQAEDELLLGAARRPGGNGRRTERDSSVPTEEDHDQQRCCHRIEEGRFAYPTPKP